MNIQELCDRYSLKSRQSIYEWCKALGIKLAKDDSNKAYATSEQINLFDELSEHLKAGNSIKSFTPLVKVTVSPSPDTVSYSLDTITEPSQTNDLIDLVNAIASIIKPNPGLSRHEELEKAVLNGWILSTSELSDIGFKVSCKNGSRFCDRGCWRFTKSGKIGHESAWIVSKIIPEKEYSIEDLIV